MILPCSFYQKDTAQVAKDLLGCILVHETPEGIISGKIVETEAYLCDDPACHASKGKTKRNESMFGPAGKAYIYFTYGMYHCFNIVTREEGIGEAVLIRALEPLEGIDLMKKNRNIEDVRNLCNGPAKLVIALGIKPSQNHQDVTSGVLRVEKARSARHEIVTTTRIGITKAAHLPLRFYIKNNPFVSKL